MVNETMSTVVGNLTADPDVRRLDSGVTVANFRVAATPRRYDRGNDQYVDGPPLYMPITCWREIAMNVAATLHKGDPVVVIGRLQTRSYTHNGQQNSRIEMEAVAVGPDLAKGTARFTRIRPSNRGSADRDPGDGAARDRSDPPQELSAVA